MEEGGRLISESNNGELSSSSLFPVVSPASAAASSKVLFHTRDFPSFASAPSFVPVTDTITQPASSSLDWLSNPTFSETFLSAHQAPPNHTAGSAPAEAVTSIALNDLLDTDKGGKDTEKKSSSSELSDYDESGGDLLAHRKSNKKLAAGKRKNEAKLERGSRKRKKQKHLRDLDLRERGLKDVVPFQQRSVTGRHASGIPREKKDYHFDTHGDQDSLVYGSLYRMDVAKYLRDEICGGLQDEEGFGLLDSLGDIEDRGGIVQDEHVKGRARYWSLKFSSVERKRKLKKLRVGTSSSARTQNLLSSPGSRLLLDVDSSFMPLETGDIPTEETGNHVGEGDGGESWAEEVAKKIRNMNKLTREKPNDVSVWIQFANFQDELMHATNNRVAIQNFVTKKTAILESALKSIPDSEDLLVLYFETCKRNDDGGTLLAKWERALHRHFGSLRMWQEYLRFRRTHFSSFSVSTIRNLYNDALRGLTAARNRLSHVRNLEYNSEDLVKAEEAVVCMFVDLCRFNWQAGHREVAVGLFQAEIEYSLLGPEMRESESTRLQNFEEFWRSGLPRLGESGALGWAEFKMGENRNFVETETQEKEEDAGGWTGWSAPVVGTLSANGKDHLLEEEDLNLEEDVCLDNDTSQKDLDATLLEKLGLDFDSSKEVEVNDVSIWKRWSEKEDQRDQEQWLPLRTGLNDANDQLERMVLYDDIKESLFTIYSQQARLSLLYEFIDFFDGTSSQCRCSNSDAYIAKLNSLVSVTAAGTESMFGDNWPDLNTPGALAKLVGTPPWHEVSTERANFLRNCLGLVKHFFLHFSDQFLLDAMLKAEAAPMETNKTAARALTKELLKVYRKDLRLWAAYGCIEAAAGNITAARNVFDTILSSLGSPSKETDQDSPFLYLAYAELELAQTVVDPDANTEHRALYILSFLGSGTAFVPQSNWDTIPKIVLLKAHRGFHEHLRRLQMSEKGNLTGRGAALIACAAHFEQLMTGWEAGARVFEEGFAMGLPQKRRQSLEFELLLLRYVRLLEKSKSSAKADRLQSVLLTGLDQYPRNSKLLGSYVHVASLSSTRYALRRFLDGASAKCSSATTQLFALLSEICSCSVSPRIHRLFERVLESKETRDSVLLWRCYLAYEAEVASDLGAARRVYFRAIHACPWSKALWLDGFRMLSSKMSAKELSEFVDMMRDKELYLRTDVYEILLEDAG